MTDTLLLRRDVDAGTIYVYEMIFTTRVGIGDETSIERAWCYQNRERALEAVRTWDGNGDPPDGWIKEVGTERRRVNGDPAREYDATTDPLGLTVGGVNPG